MHWWSIENGGAEIAHATIYAYSTLNGGAGPYGVGEKSEYTWLSIDKVGAEIALFGSVTVSWYHVHGQIGKVQFYFIFCQYECASVHFVAQ